MTSDAKQQSTPEWGAGAARARFSERRANPRYDIVVEFDLFHLWGAHHLIWAGSGKTRNWSRNSILIEWDNQVPDGASVELVARWTEGVELVVVGRVLQTATRGTVVRILRRRFRQKADDSPLPRAVAAKTAASRERAS